MRDAVSIDAYHHPGWMRFLPWHRRPRPWSRPPLLANRTSWLLRGGGGDNGWRIQRARVSDNGIPQQRRIDRWAQLHPGSRGEAAASRFKCSWAVYRLRQGWLMHVVIAPSKINGARWRLWRRSGRDRRRAQGRGGWHESYQETQTSNTTCIRRGSSAHSPCHSRYPFDADQ